VLLSNHGFPGVRTLATTPTIRPKMIQPMMPMWEPSCPVVPSKAHAAHSMSHGANEIAVSWPIAADSTR